MSSEGQKTEQRKYDAFISYSHAADDLLAPRLQAGLQRFAKPWWTRRAVRVFRDESSLAANPHLWSSITEALEDSGWFVLLLSPDAAVSEWVNKEIEHWKAHQPGDRILPVVTDGEFAWADGDVTGTSVPAALRGVFGEEPRWVDLRFAKGDDQLELKSPTFSAAVADVASAIRGVPKDELASEEVRQHRRTIRTAWAAAIVVVMLGVASLIGAVVAINESNRANEQAALAVARELAASAINLLDEDPELSILLGLEAIASTPEGQDQPVEVVDALWTAVQENRLIETVETGYGDAVFVTLSPDDSTLFVINGFPAGGFPNALVLQAYSTSNLEKLWEFQRPIADLSVLDTGETPDGDVVFAAIHVSPDGRQVALSLAGYPRRSVILDATDGTEIRSIECPEYANTTRVSGWSPDGSLFAMTGACPHDGQEGEFWVELRDGETFDLVARLDPTDDHALSGAFDDSGRLFLFTDTGGTTIYAPPGYSQSVSLESVRGPGAVSPNGSTLVTFDIPPDPCDLSLPASPPDCGTLASYDAMTGERIDLLTPLNAMPSLDGMTFGFSGSDRLFAIPTLGAETLIWDIATGDQVFSLPGGFGINAAVTADGQRAYTGHRDGEFKVWDLDPNVGLDPVGTVGTYTAISANTNTFGETVGAFVAFDPGTFASKVFFFDLATGNLVGQPVVGQQPIVALADDRFLITESYVGADAPFAWFAYDPMKGDRTRIAGCDLDLETGLCPDGRFQPNLFWVSSADGSELLRQGDGRLALIDPRDGSDLGDLTTNVEFDFVAGFSDEWIAGSFQSELHYEDRATGERLANWEAGGLRFEQSADAKALAWYLVEIIVIVDYETWDVWDFPIDLGQVEGMAVDASLRRLALGDESGIHVFDFDTGELLTSIPVRGVADLHWISEDRLLVGTETGVWATLSLLTEDLIASAAAGVTRGFTAEECATYRIDPCPSLADIQAR